MVKAFDRVWADQGAVPTTAAELWAKAQGAIDFMVKCAGKPYDQLPARWGEILLALVPEYGTLAVGQGGQPFRGKITEWWCASPLPPAPPPTRRRHTPNHPLLTLSPYHPCSRARFAAAKKAWGGSPEQALKKLVQQAKKAGVSYEWGEWARNTPVLVAAPPSICPPPFHPFSCLFPAALAPPSCTPTRPAPISPPS